MTNRFIGGYFANEYFAMNNRLYKVDSTGDEYSEVDISKENPSNERPFDKRIFYIDKSGDVTSQVVITRSCDFLKDCVYRLSSKAPIGEECKELVSLKEFTNSGEYFLNKGSIYLKTDEEEEKSITKVDEIELGATINYMDNNTTAWVITEREYNSQELKLFVSELLAETTKEEEVPSETPSFFFDEKWKAKIDKKYLGGKNMRYTNRDIETLENGTLVVGGMIMKDGDLSAVKELTIKGQFLVEHKIKAEDIKEGDLITKGDSVIFVKSSGKEVIIGIDPITQSDSRLVLRADPLFGYTVVGKIVVLSKQIGDETKAELPALFDAYGSGNVMDTVAKLYLRGKSITADDIEELLDPSSATRNLNATMKGFVGMIKNSVDNQG